MEDKGKMDELIEQMKLMNSQMTEIKGNMNERLGNVEKMLEESIYHQHRTDFTSEYVARQQGYSQICPTVYTNWLRRMQTSSLRREQKLHQYTEIGRLEESQAISILL